MSADTDGPLHTALDYFCAFDSDEIKVFLDAQKLVTTVCLKGWTGDMFLFCFCFGKGGGGWGEGCSMFGFAILE